MTVNNQIRLASRPIGLPDASNWQHTTEPITSPKDGELLVQVTHISLAPAMRGWMDDQRSYMPPVELGTVMRAPAVGRVVASQNSSFAEGSWVTGMLGVQEYAISDGAGLRRIDPDGAPLSRHLGVLGVTGITAYFGLLDIGRPRAGETVVVSGAAGAAGSVAAQIAKLEGCRVIGVAGGPEKCAWLTGELGLDAAIDYKSEDLAARLREETPDFIDVFFDNVGGEILDLVLARLALRGRIVLCGGISRYNTTESWGPTNYLSLIATRGTMQGLIVLDYQERYGEAIEKMSTWIEEGRLIAREHVVVGGVERFPDTLLAMFRGENTGKLVLELDRDEESGGRS
jgi:NADPH-dependent curcumin reductase CurA